MRHRRHALACAALFLAVGLATSAESCDPSIDDPTVVETTQASAPATHQTQAGYPTTADAYTAELAKAWQAHDQARLTDLSGPQVAAYLMGLKAPDTLGRFEDATDHGRTSVHLTGSQGAFGIDITVNYVDSGLGKAHAVVSIIDNTTEKTITG